MDFPGLTFYSIFTLFSLFDSPVKEQNAKICMKIIMTHCFLPFAEMSTLLHKNTEKQAPNSPP